MLWADSNPAHAAPAARGENKLRPQDRAVHSWYRFVLSFPPHLVQNYLSRFAVKADDTVLDPFCGTGTTLVECKKQGVGSVGLESNPIAHFASAVKVDWLTCGETLVSEAEQVAQAATKQIVSERLRLERRYARVTRLYFGGMAQHFASLREALKPGAKLAYVVGDKRPTCA